MTNVRLTPRVGVTLRGDYLNDRDGNRTGVVQEAKAACISPSYTIAEGFTALVEFRYDWSNIGSFTNADGAPTKGHAATAVEFTYGF